MTQHLDPNRTPEDWIPRKRILTDEDLDILRQMTACNHACSFTPEEVQFVKDWLDNMKTVKSELIKYCIKVTIYGIGIICAVIVAIKLGWFKIFGK